MKNLVISNIIILFVVLLFHQMNASIFNYIHFNPAQSFFTRFDYLMIFLVIFVFFIISVFIVYKYIKSITNSNVLKILFYEFVILYFIALVLSSYYIYLVFVPPVYLKVLLPYNKPYNFLVFFYIIEVLCISILLVKKLIRKNYFL